MNLFYLGRTCWRFLPGIRLFSDSYPYSGLSETTGFSLDGTFKCLNSNERSELTFSSYVSLRSNSKSHCWICLVELRSLASGEGWRLYLGQQDLTFKSGLPHLARTCVALIELLILTLLLVGTKVLAFLRIGLYHSIAEISVLFSRFWTPNLARTKVALIELLLTFLLVGTTALDPP